MSVSKLKEAMTLLVQTFYEYSSGDEDSSTMTMSELSDVLWVEFKEPEYIEELEAIFKNLDTDGNNVVTFKEFVGIIVEITKKSPDLDKSNLSETFEDTSTLIKIMRKLMECFDEYAELSGHKDTMSKGEAIFMISEQLSDMGFTEALDIAKKLDSDKDGAVTFKEFVAIVTELEPLYRLK